MAADCRLCGESSPDEAFFCIGCGAVLQPQQHHTVIYPINSVVPTIRAEPQAMVLLHTFSLKMHHWTWRERINWAGVPLLALCFSIEFLMGLTEMFRAGGLPWVGLWGLGPVIMGALFAEEEWVNHPRWPSFLGMLIWGSMPWLLATRLLPCGLGLCMLWVALRIRRR